MGKDGAEGPGDKKGASTVVKKHTDVKMAQSNSRDSFQKRGRPESNGDRDKPRNKPFLQGNQGNSRNSGGSGGKSLGPCFDFQKGICDRGEDCRFSHISAGSERGYLNPRAAAASASHGKNGKNAQMSSPFDEGAAKKKKPKHLARKIKHAEEVGDDEQLKVCE